MEDLLYTPAGAVKGGGKYACDIRTHFASYFQSSAGEVPQQQSTMPQEPTPLQQVKVIIAIKLPKTPNQCEQLCYTLCCNTSCGKNKTTRVWLKCMYYNHG